MCPDENNSEDYGRRRGFHRREQGVGASSNGVWVEKNKNKFEMYGWRNPVPQVAHSVHSVFRTPTLQDIPEESDENSDDGQKHVSSNNSVSYSRRNTMDRCQSFPAQIAHESEFSLRDSDTRTFVNVASSEVQVKGSNDIASVPMIDQEFTDMLFLQLQIVKKTLLEMKEQKQVIEDELQSSLESNQQLRKEINFLTDKIKDFQQQEEVMIADRRILASKVVAAREKILEKEKDQELFLEKQKSVQDNKDQQENVKLANENTQLRSKLENAQNTIRKMMEEKIKWEEDEIVFKTREKEFLKENSRIAIELEVYKQKVKKLETIKNIGNASSANSSITSTSGQLQEISNPKPQDPIQTKVNTSYIEVVSSTPAIPGEKADKILENILLSPKKNLSQSADSSKYPSYDKLLPTLKGPQDLQNKSSGLAGLVTFKENKESLIGRSDYKSLTQRIEVLEAKVNPLTNLVNKTVKSQHANQDELEKRFNQSILAVTNQITSLRKMLETVMNSELESKKSAPTAISNYTNAILANTIPDSISQSNNTCNFKLNHSKNSSKSYIPVSVNRKSC